MSSLGCLRPSACLLAFRTIFPAWRAEDYGKPASAKSVQAYIARVFGGRLAKARAAMEGLAADAGAGGIEPVGFRLCEQFRPRVAPRAGGPGVNCSSNQSRSPAADDPD
jgi:hypothetical protein